MAALMPKNFRILLFFFLVLLIGFFFSPDIIYAGNKSRDTIAAKVAICPELPNVHWWKTTRIKIVKYVDFKYNGNWEPYIKRWQEYKSKMQNILDNNGTALVKAKKIRLSGKTLALHISEIEKRLEVKRCLAGIFSGQVAINELRIPMIRIEQIRFHRNVSEG